MVGPIPDAARPPPADEITVDDDTRIVSMPDKPVEKAAPAIAKAHDDEDEPEPEEVTRLMDTKGEGERTSAPKIEAPAHGPKVELHPPKVEVQQPKVEPAAEPKVVVERPAPKIEGEKVVVSAAARPPAKVEEPAPAPVVAPIPSAIIDDQPPEPKELTSPSRRYEPLPEPIPGVPTGGKRTPMWVLAAAAVVLLGAAAVVGLRNGWFGGGPEPVLSALPAPSNTVPAVKETASAAPAVTTTATAAVTAVEPAVSATVATSATAPADTASAATSAAAPPASASVAPATSATAAPTAEPEGDGSALAANKGYLIVNSTNPAGVYLTGVFVGATGKKLEADCGFKFLRLGVPPADGNPRPGEVTWVSDGKSIAVGCQKTTTVTLEAGK
ncbi:MAG: hypothetical protein U0359_06870 [Byssovorax sp.]